jgi:hypothetical protein
VAIERWLHDLLLSSTSAVTVLMSMLWGWDTFVVLLFVELRSLPRAEKLRRLPTLTDTLTWCSFCF